MGKTVREAMRVLIAPDKFKGVLTAGEAAELIRSELAEILPEAELEIQPMADGGEGTAEAIGEALGGSWEKCRAHDPLGRPIDARYFRTKEGKRVVMDMSEVAGWARVDASERDPDAASTIGVGEMILFAAKDGAEEIIVGLGGSLTNDGGVGMARGLGYRFFGEGKELGSEVLDLLSLDRIEPPADKPWSEAKIVGAADVSNPLLGENGAIQTFGRQKGVKPDALPKFEAALARLADVVERDLGQDERSKAGAGAAGGLGFGLTVFASAALAPGFAVVAEAVSLREKMARADIVVTGEGKLDRQTLAGKTPAGVAKMARDLGKPVYGLAGQTDGDEEVARLFQKLFIATPPGMAQEEAMSRAKELLRAQARKLGQELKSARLSV